MSDNQWGEDDQQPVKKKGMPTWLKIGCGGCGVLLLVVILGVGFVFTKSKDAANPDVQWPALAEVIAFDERPAGYTIIRPLWFQEQYTLRNTSTGDQLQISQFSGGQGTSTREELFGGDEPKIPKNLLVFKFVDFEKGTVPVQGRELPLFRFRMEPGSMMPKGDENPFGPACWIDLTKPGGEFTYAQLIFPKQDGPISDGQIQQILAPFHVGPDRSAVGGLPGDVEDRLDEATREGRDALDQAIDEAADSLGEDG